MADDMTVVAMRLHAELSSERERRVAAQEAITLRWQPLLCDIEEFLETIVPGALRAADDDQAIREANELLDKIAELVKSQRF